MYIFNEIEREIINSLLNIISRVNLDFYFLIIAVSHFKLVVNFSSCLFYFSNPWVSIFPISKLNKIIIDSWVEMTLLRIIHMYGCCQYCL